MNAVDWILGIASVAVVGLSGWALTEILGLKMEWRSVVDTIYPRDEPSLPRRIAAIEKQAAENAGHSQRVEAKVDAVKESLDDHRAEAPAERKRAAREVVEQLRRAGMRL